MDGERRYRRDRIGVVRRSDLEPYTALRWVASLFKAASVFLIVAVVAEVIAGLRIEGWAALPILLGEIARTAVLAVVLWGGGDLVRLMIDIGHDIRANRVLQARQLGQNARLYGQSTQPPGRSRTRPHRMMVSRREEPAREAGPEAAD